VKNSSTSLKDRAEAGLVGGVMLAKRGRQVSVARCGNTELTFSESA